MKRPIVLAWLGSLAFICLVCFGQADDDIFDENDELGDIFDLPRITITGEIQERDLQDTHTSVSVELGEKLDVSADKDLFDVIDRLPGVNAQGGGFGFVIRGIPDGGVGGGSGQTINVQVDGVSVPNGQALHTGALSTWDLEQVEVLRGPQSTQQGQNALAGAIILRGRNPIFEQELKLRADYGTFNETRFAVAANQPLGENLAFRLAYEDYQSDGDIAHWLTGEDIADESLRTFRGKVRYQPRENFDVIFTQTRSENRLAAQGIHQDVFPEKRIGDQVNNSEGTTDMSNLLMDYVINDNWAIISETGYLKSDYILDFPIEPDNPRNTPALRTVLDTTYSQEFKLNYSNPSLSWTSGLFFRDTEKDLFFNAIVPDASRYGFPPGTSARFGNTFDEEIGNSAFFSEAEYDLNDKITLIAGIRYDSEDQESVSTNFSAFDPEPFPGANADPTPVHLEADYKAFLPKLALVYQVSEDISHGFTVQRGYRAGGSATDFISSQQYEYDPEFTTNLEYSLRSLSLGGRLRANANFFHTDYKDMQLSLPGPSGTFLDSRIENAGAATLYGFELETNLNATNQLTLFFNVGYTKTQLDEYVVADAMRNPISLAGNQFSQAPQWTGSIGGDYDFDNGFEIAVDGSFTDKSFYTVNNDPGELNSSFFLVNARFGYQSNSFWSVYLYSRNLFDRQYLARRRADGFGSAGDSRVVGINVNANF